MLFCLPSDFQLGIEKGCWIIPKSNLKISKELGSGHFNTVRLGVMKTCSQTDTFFSLQDKETPPKGTSMEVAVKMPKGKCVTLVLIHCK